MNTQMLAYVCVIEDGNAMVIEHNTEHRTHIIIIRPSHLVFSILLREQHHYSNLTVANEQRTRLRIITGMR